MKRRTIIVPALAATLLLGAVGFAVLRRFHAEVKQVTVSGYFKPDDVSQIQATLQYYRRQLTRSELANPKLKGTSDLKWTADVAFARIREIIAMDDRPYKDLAPSITNPPLDALVHTDGWLQGQGPSYYLERTTNGWQLVQYGNF